MNVYSCSMPNRHSCLANFLADFTRAARVFVGCGLPSAAYTSHSTSLSWPPRMGSGAMNTGSSTQSLLSPVAWFVLEPSNPQTGGSSPSGTIFVFDRNLAVGSVPSIQMYSAL